MTLNNPFYKEIIDLDETCFEKWKASFGASHKSYSDWVSRNPGPQVSAQDLSMMNALKREITDSDNKINRELFEQHCEKIAFAFFYRDYCHDYGNDNNQRDQNLITYICKSWELNRSKNLYNAYVENAHVWFNLTEFWDNIGWEDFMKKFYVGDHDFEEQWNNLNSDDYYYPPQEDYNTRVSQYNFNYIILTANPIEHQVVAQFLKRLPRYDNKKIKRFSPNANSKCEFLKVGKGVSILHVAANSMGSFTKCGSEKVLSELIIDKERKCILISSLGIAYGMNPETQKLADVLVSSSMISHHTFKRKNDIIQLLKDEYYDTAHEVREFWNGEGWKEAAKEYSFKTIVGPMLSGGAVLSDSWEKNRIQKACKKIHNQIPIGGEMEGDGMYRVCRKEVNLVKDYPCVVIKGICDWGALKNSWSLVANDLSNKRIDEDGTEVVYNGDTLIEDQYGIPVEPNDVIKNSVQALGVKRALLVWGYYFTKISGEHLLKKNQKAISLLLEELKNEVKMY